MIGTYGQMTGTHPKTIGTYGQTIGTDRRTTGAYSSVLNTSPWSDTQFLVLSRPWSLIGNLVADPRLRRFDSRWLQTLTLCAALGCQIDLAIRQMLRCDRQIDLAPDAALRAICAALCVAEELC